MSNKPETTHIALDRGWGPTPSDVHRTLEQKDCFDTYNKLIVMDLLSMVSLKEKEVIAGDTVYAGWTCYISVPGLAKRNGMSDRKVQGCIKELESKGVIERRRTSEKEAFQYRVSIIYLEAFKRMEADPHRPTCLLYTSPSPRDS